MTIYAIIFEDDENHANQRAKYLDKHLEFLEASGEKISAAGPLQDAVTNSPAGGLWLMEAECAQVVKELVEADPLWPTGLRKSVRILEWTQVFRDRVRQI